LVTYSACDLAPVSGWRSKIASIGSRGVVGKCRFWLILDFLSKNIFFYRGNPCRRIAKSLQSMISKIFCYQPTGVPPVKEEMSLLENQTMSQDLHFLTTTSYKKLQNYFCEKNIFQKKL